MDNSATRGTNTGIESKITKLDADLDHTSPIKSLPNEILSEIFVQALHSLHPPFPDVDNPTFGDTSLAPVRQMRGCILRVCWRWRQTSLSEPRLWQVVNLTIGSPSLQVDAEAWKHIQERIAWAGSLKIHLVVYHMKSSASINDDWGFKLFCGVLPRLLSLQVSLERGLVMASIQLDDPPAMYSNLKQICVEASGYPETRAWCENLLSNTPEVVCLALPSPENMSFSPTVLSNLRFLSLGRAEPDDVVTVLDCARRLLSLHVECSDGIPCSGRTRIIQSQLHRLRINEGELASFLPRLTLPALRHLTFRAESLWPTHEILHFFERSQCKLVALEAQTEDAHIFSSISRIMETQETLTTLRFSPQDSYDTSAVPDAFISCLSKLPRLAVCHFIIESSQIPTLQCALSARLKAQKADEVVRMEDWVVTIVVENYQETHCDAFDEIVHELSKSGSTLRVKDGLYESDSSGD